MFRFLIAAAVISLAALVYGFFRVDSQVARSLDSLDVHKVAAIYSEPFMLFQGSKLGVPQLRRQLSKRQYVESPTLPVSAGEFHIEGNVLTVITREFLLPNGKLRKVSKITYNFDTGEIFNNSNPSQKDFLLEPLIIAPLGSGDIRVSSYKRLSDFPPFLPKAFIAIEDIRFYDHWGIDLVGIGRAMVKNILAGGFVQGGSTITQQLAKNLFFSSEKTIVRKIKEAFAAISLERRLSKDKILELYLNEVYFGRDGSVSIHGVSEASQSFLGKTIDDINLSEAALLAGMVKAPSALAIRKHMNRAIERRDIVLQAMKDASFIGDADLRAAQSFKVVAYDDSVHKRIAPHYVSAMRSEMEKNFDVDTAISSGLAVFTGMDREMQECAEVAVAEGLAKIEKQYPSVARQKEPLEAALISMEPYSGLIKAWVGGRDYAKNQYDHVISAKRQIGSTIKPFVYLTALDPAFNSYRVASPSSILQDESIEIKVPGGTWAPQNYDEKFRGDVTLRYALENSLNVPAVRLSQKVGIENVASVIERFHINENVSALPSLALGATEATLLDLTSAYGALANGGIYVRPRLFSGALNSSGDISVSVPLNEEVVAEPAPVYILTNILQGVIERGTARGIRASGFTGTAAGKTGTTNDARDAWFVGFTSSLVTGVWVGFDDNKKIGLTGGAVAAPIWASYMKCVSPYFDDLPFLAPKGVVIREVDSLTHQIVPPNCPVEARLKEVFLEGYEPPAVCPAEGEVPAVEEFDRSDDSTERRSPSMAEEIEMENRKSFWSNLFGGE